MDKKKKVYDVLVKQTNYQDSYEEFEKSMNEEASRKKVYDILVSRTQYKDSYEDYSKSLGYEATPQSTPKLQSATQPKTQPTQQTAPSAPSAPRANNEQPQNVTPSASNVSATPATNTTQHTTATTNVADATKQANATTNVADANVTEGDVNIRDVFGEKIDKSRYWAPITKAEWESKDEQEKANKIYPLFNEVGMGIDGIDGDSLAIKELVNGQATPQAINLFYKYATPEQKKQYQNITEEYANRNELANTIASIYNSDPSYFKDYIGELDPNKAADFFVDQLGYKNYAETKKYAEQGNDKLKQYLVAKTLGVDYNLGKNALDYVMKHGLNSASAKPIIDVAKFAYEEYSGPKQANIPQQFKEMLKRTINDVTKPDESGRIPMEEYEEIEINGEKKKVSRGVTFINQALETLDYYAWVLQNIPSKEERDRALGNGWEKRMFEAPWSPTKYEMVSNAMKYVANKDLFSDLDKYYRNASKVYNDYVADHVNKTASKKSFGQQLMNAIGSTAGAASATDMQSAIASNTQAIGSTPLNQLFVDWNELDTRGQNAYLAKKMIEDLIDLRENGNSSNIVEGLYKGFKSGILNPSSWDLGKEDLAKAMAIKRAIEKMTKEEKLTTEEDALMEAVALTMASKSVLSPDVSFKVGQGVGMSIPYLLEMAFPVKGGSALAKGLTKWALKKFGKKAMISPMGKVFRGGVNFVGGVTDAVSRAAIIGGGGIGAGTTEGMTPGYGLGQDNKIVLTGEKGKDVGSALAESFYEQAVTYWVEGPGGNLLGRLFKPIGKGLKRVGVDLDDANSIWNKFLKKTGWNGTPTEYAEEVLTQILQTPVNETTLDANEKTGIFTLENQVTTFLTCATLGTVLNLPNVGVQSESKRIANYRNDLNNVGQLTFHNKWGNIKNRIDNATPSEIEGIVMDEMMKGNYTAKQKKVILKYAGARVQQDALLLRENELAMEAKASKVIDAQGTLNDKTKEGYNATDENEQRRMAILAQQSEQEVKAMLGENEPEAMSALNTRYGVTTAEDLVAKVVNDESLTPEQRNAILNYINTDASKHAIEKRMADDANALIMQAKREIDSYANEDAVQARNPNNVIEAKLKEDDSQVYVISGNVELLEDGTVSTKGSSESIVVFNPNAEDPTKQKVMTTPAQLYDVTKGNAQAMLDERVSQIKAEHQRKLTQVTTGERTFEINQQITIPTQDGQGVQTATITNITPGKNGSPLITYTSDVDGTTSQVTIPKAEVEQKMDEVLLIGNTPSVNEAPSAITAEPQISVPQAPVAEVEETKPIEVEDNVTFEVDGNQLQGVVASIEEGDGVAIVQTEDEKVHRVPLDNLTIVEETATKEQGGNNVEPTANATSEGSSQEILDNSNEVEQNVPIAPTESTPQAETPSESTSQDANDSKLPPLMGIPTDENGNKMYESASVEATINDIYNDPELDEEEADAYVQARIDGATQRIADLEAKKPKMGESKEAYIAERATWREELATQQASLDYWNGVQEARAKVKSSETNDAIDESNVPMMSAEEYGRRNQENAEDEQRTDNSESEGGVEVLSGTQPDITRGNEDVAGESEEVDGNGVESNDSSQENAELDSLRKKTPGLKQEVKSAEAEAEAHKGLIEVYLRKDAEGKKKAKDDLLTALQGNTSLESVGATLSNIRGRKRRIGWRKRQTSGEARAEYRALKFLEKAYASRARELYAMDRLGKALGVTIEVVDQVDGGKANGKIVGNKILIAKDADQGVKEALAHEMLHRIKALSEEAYESFAKALEGVFSQRIGLGNGQQSLTFQEMMVAKRILYSQHGMDISLAGVREEVVADMAGILMTNAELMEKFVESTEGKPWYKEIWDTIKEIFEVAKAALKGVEYRDMMEAEYVLLDAIYKAVDVQANPNKANKVEPQDVEKHSLAGIKGATALDRAEEVTQRMDNLESARKMEKYDYPKKAIRMATGWERGADGKWRYEIEDDFVFDIDGNVDYGKRNPQRLNDYKRYKELLHKKNALAFDGEELNAEEKAEFDDLAVIWKGTKLHNSTRLKDYIDHPELFEAYPELRDVSISFDNINARGEYDSSANEITLSNTLSPNEAKSTLIHEIQHAIQKIEGFARGGNVEASKNLIRERNNKALIWSFQKNISHMAKNNPGLSPLELIDKVLARRVELTGDNIATLEEQGAIPNEDGRIKAYNLWARGYDNEGYENAYNMVLGDDAFEVYRRHAGEVESRNVQSRMGMTPDQRRATLLAETEDVARKDQIFLMENSGVSAMAEDANESVVDINEQEGQALFSLRSYNEGGRDAVQDFVNKQVDKGALTQEQANEIVTELEDIYNICEQYKDEYAPFGAWSDAKVVADERGVPVFSVIKKNGDYGMNLDFSLVCKKRRTLDAVFQEMINRGVISNFELGQVDIARINDIIREHGFETACRLCFVDSKRFRTPKVADDFANLYNELVEMSDAQLKKVIKGEAKNTVRKKTANHLLKHPEDRIKVGRDNFITAQGFEQMQVERPEILKLYNQAKGSGGPKASFGDTQYMNDIQNTNWTPEKAYAVGGVRLQSFSDYVPRMVFDYVQLIADLASKGLPVHAYTKEPIFAKQFGLTGVKINLSLVPRVDADGVAPGLDKDGNYAWQDGESFPYDEAVALQNAEGYKENVGTIAVGVSDAHIAKMLDDPNIRMVIPYHKSGLNKQVAIKNNIDAFNDYTTSQNTRKADGTKVDKKGLKGQPDFNQDIHNGMHPRDAAQKYLDWCDKKGYLPKFDQFRDHPNYYKLLEDFTTIIEVNGVEQVAPQGAVKMQFPTENDAFGSMESLVKEGLEEDAILEGNRQSKVGDIVDEIEDALADTKYSLRSNSQEVADIVAKAKADGTYMKAPNGEPTNLTEEQWANVRTKAFKDWFGDWENDPENASKVVDENGEPMVVYHGSWWNPMAEEKGEAVFDESFRGTASGDNGFFGRGHYFTFGNGNLSKLEASYYGPNITNAFLNIRNPFMWLETFYKDYNPNNGQSEHNATLFAINAVDVLPGLVEGLEVEQFNNVGDVIGKISIEDYVKKFEDIYKNKEFIVERDEYNSNIVVIKADPVEHIEENGYSWTEYGFELPIVKPSAREDKQFLFTHYYLTQQSYNEGHPYYILPERELNEISESEELTATIKSLGYDGVLQSATGDEVVAFAPNQIKSATDNVGTYSSEDNDIRYSLRSNSPFYSNAEYAVENIKQGKATPEQWLAMIQKNGGLKAGEDKWLGLSDWLKASVAKTLTKEEVLEFINQNKIVIEEVGYGGDSIASAQSEFDELTEELGGYDEAFEEMVNRYGDDFRVAVWYDEVGQLHLEDGYEDYGEILGTERGINRTRLDYTTEGLENKKEIALVVPSVAPYNAHDEIHFGDAGGGRAVAWVRFGETTDENGNRVLVIDEIQSKRHQDGREKGYRDAEMDKRAEEARKAYIEADKAFNQFREQLMEKYNYSSLVQGTAEERREGRKIWRSKFTPEEMTKYDQLHNKIIDTLAAHDNLPRQINRVPDAPFDKNWHELAMKRMLRYAAENGYDKVAWTTGAQQAERYNMGSMVKAIRKGRENDIIVIDLKNGEYIPLVVDKNGLVINGKYQGEKLSNIIGKELAEKAMDLPIGESLADVDLHIGGEGMKGFYDKMLPSFMNKYGKKWGVKVGEVTMPELQDGYQTMHSIDVTDAMKESVMEGQPLFSLRSDVDLSYANDPFAKALGKSQRTKAQQAKFAERERKAMRNKIDELVNKLHLENVEVIEKFEATDQSSATAKRKARAKGWFDSKTGKIVINLGNHLSVADVERTLLHEAVAHYGLRELFGEQFDTFLDNVYNNAEGEIKTQIDAIAKGREVDTRTATEEYLASLAEDTQFEYLENQTSFWMKIKQLFMDMLESIGWDYKGPELSDNELRYLLWRSYENMVNPGRHRSILGMAEDVVKREKFGIGTYNTDEDIESQVADGEGVKYSIRTKPEPKNVKEVYKLFNVDENGMPQALFIDADNKLKLGVWYDADSPKVKDLENLEPGKAYLINENGDVEDEKEFKINVAKGGKKSISQLPSKEQVIQATKDGNRWMTVRLGADGERQYHTLGINGAGGVTDYALRPGWHATDSPSARHIGEGKSGANAVYRKPNQRWFKVEISADHDYNEEAREGYLEAHPKAKRKDVYDNLKGDIADKIPEDGFYNFKTNSNANPNQSWFIAGAMKIVEPLTEEEAHEISRANGVEIDLPYKDGVKTFEDVKAEQEGTRYSLRDNQGNPIDENGRLIVEEVSSIDEITDADFDSPTRSIQLPSIPPKVDEAIGANGKPIVIKKNVFEKNKKSHKDLTPKDSRAILLNTLYSPDLYGQNQKITRPYNWILIHLADTNTAVLVEVNENKDNVEIVNWHYINDDAIERKKKQAIREGGLILTLESAAADTSNFLPSADKVNNNLGENQEDDTKYSLRSGDGLSNPDKVIAREAYERMVASGRYQFTEAMQDSMMGLKLLYKAILGKKMQVENIPDFENAYIAENLMSSQNAAMQQEYYIKFMKPLVKAIHSLGGKDKAKRQAIIDYMMAKHGLERNQVMAHRDAKALADEAVYGIQFNTESEKQDTWQKAYDKAYKENREVDYAGLTALTGTDKVAEAEAKATEMVEQFETDNNKDNAVTELWARVNDATKANLERLRKGGVISTQQYRDTLEMYEYYIPLRGWDATTSDEVYAYLTSKNSGMMGSTMKGAKGRKSKADDPIATIGAMADSAIREANRNAMKQRFLNFVLNHPSDLVSVDSIWLQYDDVTNTWIPVFADIKAEDTPDVIEQKLQEFNEKMQQLRNENPGKYKHDREAQNIPYVVKPGMDKEHQVMVKRNGQTYILTINGNPRAAQALNGLTNPDVDVEGWIGKLLNGAEKVNRQLSAFYTTRNPDFVVSNFSRDMIYSNAMAWVKESPKYAVNFHANCGVAFTMLPKLLIKWERGTLDMNNSLEEMFYQFMINGGETGYTEIRDVEKHKRMIASELKKHKNVVKNTWHGFGAVFDGINRQIENTARFAAFKTSREMGRTVQRSAYDAKEISVNFNKKGSGAKMLGATGQTFWGDFGAWNSGLGRTWWVFWNAGVQGMTNFGKNVKRHPVKATALMSLAFVLGACAPTWNDDDDDDKKKYYLIPEYIRRSNICFRVWGDTWCTIPLPIELRAMYGLGELYTAVTSGGEKLSNEELAYAIAGQVSQVLPLDMLEGGGGLNALIPTAIKPIVEAYRNIGWHGGPIHREFYTSDMADTTPQWTLAYPSVSSFLMNFTKALNEWSGGENYEGVEGAKPNDAIKGEIDLNPAKIEYVLKGYFGGVYTTFNNIIKSTETVFGDRKFEAKNTPVYNRLFKEDDPEAEKRKYNKIFYKDKEADAIMEKRIKNAIKFSKGSLEYADKLAQLQKSDEYKSYVYRKGYKEAVKLIQKRLNYGDELINEEDLNARIDALKKEMAEGMESADNKSVKKLEIESAKRALKIDKDFKDVDAKQNEIKGKKRAEELKEQGASATKIKRSKGYYKGYKKRQTKEFDEREAEIRRMENEPEDLFDEDDYEEQGD